jgi:sorting nexin-4
MDDNFDSVQWRDDDEDSVDDFAHHISSVKSPGLNGLPGSGEPLQAGPNADAIDLAGAGRGALETTVSDPQTEGEGTKDAYVSYLVRTEVFATHPYLWWY